MRDEREDQDTGPTPREPEGDAVERQNDSIIPSSPSEDAVERGARALMSDAGYGYAPDEEPGREDYHAETRRIVRLILILTPANEEGNDDRTAD